MASFTFVSLLSVLTVIVSVLATPLQETRDLVTRATPAPPHWVIYTDKWISGETGPPAASDIAGYNVLMLSVLLSTGAKDQASEWTLISDADRASYKAAYSAAGIKLLVSAFGVTDPVTTNGVDPVSLANTMAAWVKQYDLDGIDVDYEDFDAINKGDGSAETWLISFTKTLRSQLPAGDYIITHAPVAPWFRNDGHYGGGGYIKVNSEVGSDINWYNVQFYNQGTAEYTTCDGLLTESSSANPDSALFQIGASGVDLNKLVIGKPAQATGDATDGGYIDPSVLAGCINTAKSKGWDAGVMVWQFPDAAASWIRTVRSQSWPV